jgi:hypothetical protein
LGEINWEISWETSWNKEIRLREDGYIIYEGEIRRNLGNKLDNKETRLRAGGYLKRKIIWEINWEKNWVIRETRLPENNI